MFPKLFTLCRIKSTANLLVVLTLNITEGYYHKYSMYPDEVIFQNNQSSRILDFTQLITMSIKGQQLLYLMLHRLLCVVEGSAKGQSNDDACSLLLLL